MWEMDPRPVAARERRRGVADGNGPIRLSHLITTGVTTTLLHYLRYLTRARARSRAEGEPRKTVREGRDRGMKLGTSREGNFAVRDIFTTDRQRAAYADEEGETTSAVCRRDLRSPSSGGARDDFIRFELGGAPPLKEQKYAASGTPHDQTAVITGDASTARIACFPPVYHLIESPTGPRSP